MILILHALLLMIGAALAQTGPNICDILDIKNCSGVSRQGRRASFLSAPNPTTAAILNPATVSFDRGFGVEAMFQSGNPVVFSAASGTGRIGGALISTSLENTFFGNRVSELDDSFLKRSKDKKQYKNRKLGLAFGGKLFRQKHFSLDLGFILKRHDEIKKINPGVGVSGRLGFLTYGASVYKDDFYLDFVGHIDPATNIPYTTLMGKEDYSETFTVTTYTVGTKYKGFSFDYGVIKSQYKYSDNDSNIQLFAGSYIYKNLMFNLAYRKEKSFAPLFEDDQLKYKENKSAVFSGVQVSLGKHFIVGLNYNYFLLNEFSLSSSIFF